MTVSLSCHKKMISNLSRDCMMRCRFFSLGSPSAIPSANSSSAGAATSSSGDSSFAATSSSGSSHGGGDTTTDSAASVGAGGTSPFQYTPALSVKARRGATNILEKPMSLLSLKEQAEVVFQQVEILEKVQLLEWEKGRDCVELEAQLVGKNFSPFGGGGRPIWGGVML